MGLFDSHCHLQDPAFDGERDAVLARALAELEGVVVVGDDVASSEAAVALARPRVYATVGIHPHHADRADRHALETLKALARAPYVVAWGEIGLDYHYMNSAKAVQREAFTAQLDIAAELGMPVVIHNRESHDDMATILDNYRSGTAGEPVAATGEPVVTTGEPVVTTGVMHCFDGDPAFAERCLGWRLCISFAGNLTFPKRGDLREAARIVPVERLLVETDSPYLAPQAVRGKWPCEPIYVRHTAECLARIKGLSLAELARHTTANAQRMFGPTQR